MKWRIDRVVMCQPAKLGLPAMPVQRFDSFTLRLFVMSEFDNEETGISQCSSQTNGALAEWKYASE